MLDDAEGCPGLIAMTKAQAIAMDKKFDPLSSGFGIEVLLNSNGRCVKVPVHMDRPSRALPLKLDDLRQLKHRADARFGEASRLVQFCGVGASGMVIDLSCYALLQIVLSGSWLSYLKAPIIGGPLDLAVAGALAIALALTWNFSLNRRLTFNYARHGSVVRQFLAYVFSNAMGIALSFSLRLYLPLHMVFFRQHKLAAAVVGIITATGLSFSMSRWLVFRGRVGKPRRTNDPEVGSASQVAQASSLL
ncbi:MAG: hypothetical protein NVSMB9_21080 [Isosphaeraceae bacterium]